MSKFKMKVFLIDESFERWYVEAPDGKCYPFRIPFTNHMKACDKLAKEWGKHGKIITCCHVYTPRKGAMLFEKEYDENK